MDFSIENMYLFTMLLYIVLATLQVIFSRKRMWNDALLTSYITVRIIALLLVIPILNRIVNHEWNISITATVIYGYISLNEIRSIKTIKTIIKEEENINRKNSLK
jgi:hypothetical protein